MSNKEICHSWENFRIAAGESEGKHAGPPFHDGDFYKWLEAASRIYGGQTDSSWAKLIDSIISIIGKVQREDGYIFTCDAIRKQKTGKSQDLQNDLNFEVYNMGHLMSAGCIHFKYTGKTSLLEIAEKAANYLKNQFDTKESTDARTAICPSHYMGLAQLYETTGRNEYLQLLKRLIQLRDEVPNGTDDNQDRIPLKEQKEIIGHAVRASYLYAGLTDLYRELGDQDYKNVLESVWEDLVSRKIYITGGCGALYDGVSPYGCKDYHYIQRTHQSFGRAYELPNMAGYNETCAAIGNYLWNYRMARAFGHGKYGDYMERSLYNSILSGISLDSERYFYTNALRCLDDLPYPLKWSRHREPYITSFCCPPNVLRTIAETPDMLCVVKKDGPAFLLYGDCRVQFEFRNGSQVILKMDSSYPFSGQIDLTVELCNIPREFPLYLRIPGWTDEYSLMLNGEPQENLTANQGFLRIERTWKQDDRIRLSLPMRIEVYESHPMVEENCNHIAIMRGPLVYCLESADIPGNHPVRDFYYKAGTKFKEVQGSILNVKMTLLKGELWIHKRQAWEKSELYRKRQYSDYSKVDVTLIPYFSWDNREKGEMTVWLPLLPDEAK